MSNKITLKQRILLILQEHQETLTCAQLTKRINEQTNSTYYDICYISAVNVSSCVAKMVKEEKLLVIPNYGIHRGNGYKLNPPPPFSDHELRLLAEGGGLLAHRRKGGE